LPAVDRATVRAGRSPPLTFLDCTGVHALADLCDAVGTAAPSSGMPGPTSVTYSTDD